MAVGLLAIHKKPIALAPNLPCAPIIGWRTRFSHAIQPACVAEQGAEQIQISPDFNRATLAAGTVLAFQDYGWHYLDVTLTQPLEPGDEIAHVDRLKSALYPTARAAAGVYSLEGATLTGVVLDGRDGPQIATFTPRFVGSPADGVIDSEVALADLPEFAERCDDPPYWLKAQATIGSQVFTLVMGQFQADVLGAYGVVSAFEILPSLDPKQIVGFGAATLPAISTAGTATQGLITLGDGSIVLPGLGGSGTGAILLSADGLQLFPSVSMAGFGSVATEGDGAAILPGATTAGGSEVILLANGAAIFGAIDTTGTASASASGDGAATFPVFVEAGTASLFSSGNGAQTLPAAITAGSSDVALPADGAATFGAVATAGTASAAVSGDGAATMPISHTSGTGNLQVAGDGAAIMPTPTTNGTASAETAGITPLLIPSVF